jgi:hypothetical protein
MATLEETDPAALTSCPGWTAHHLAAHIAGNYEEVRRHVEAHNRGTPLTKTRSWEEREASWRELAHGLLLRRLVDEAAASATAIAEAVEARPDAVLAWTGRTVAVAGFPTHMRSEDALHRWDIAGDDDLSRELLGQADLLAHAVTFIGGPLCQKGLDAGAGEPAFRARVRSSGHDDLVVAAGAGRATLTLESPRGEAAIEGDSAARLLLLWGRKPSPFSRLRQRGRADGAVRLQALPTGY